LPFERPDPDTEILGCALMTAPDRPLTPGEALARLFMDNADHGRNAENDALVEALRQRAREIQALLPDTTKQQE
jgi:hypothetical protein